MANPRTLAGWCAPTCGGCLEAVRQHIHDRPSGSGEQEQQLAAIRLVLDSFDWETDDRQDALEQIEEIVRGGDDR